MPGATSLGIPYPLQGETVTNQSWQDMAEAVDALMTQLDTLRDVAVSRDTAAISGGTIALTTATDTTVTGFTTVDWDTAGYANLGVNNDRLTVPAGLYWAICGASITGFTTWAVGRVGILTGTTVWGANNIDILTAGGGSTIALAWSAGLVLCTGSTAIQVRGRWNGTGGPATLQSCRLRLYKVRTLADL